MGDLEKELYLLQHFADNIREGNYADQRLYLLRHIERALAALPTGEAAAWRHPFTLPEVGSKFVALYNDGSGAFFGFRHDGGFLDQDGEDFETLLNVERWAYLPAGFEFHCEGGVDPVTLPKWEGIAAAPAAMSQCCPGPECQDETGCTYSAGEAAPAPSRDDVLEEAMREAINLLAERKYGSPARSPGHNARLALEWALRARKGGK